jgi:hypothetical protein
VLYPAPSPSLLPLAKDVPFGRRAGAALRRTVLARAGRLPSPSGVFPLRVPPEGRAALPILPAARPSLCPSPSFPASNSGRPQDMPVGRWIAPRMGPYFASSSDSWGDATRRLRSEKGFAKFVSGGLRKSRSASAGRNRLIIPEGSRLGVMGAVSRRSEVSFRRLSCHP